MVYYCLRAESKEQRKNKQKEKRYFYLQIQTEIFHELTFLNVKTNLLSTNNCPLHDYYDIKR